jgi:hypothetical protein
VTLATDTLKCHIRTWATFNNLFENGFARKQFALCKTIKDLGELQNTKHYVQG